MDTIFALSSGAPPAALAVMRISGPAAFETIRALAGDVPAPRRASLRTLRHEGVALDRALILTFPAPRTATGEDLVELHLHGGRAVVRAVEHALAAQPGLRRAVAGEFTRRALAHGVMDLAQAEGLADLLEAETEVARRSALAASEGAVSRRFRAWRDRIIAAAAIVEAALDFSDEGDVGAVDVSALRDELRGLRAEWAHERAAPSVERLRQGFTVVIAGPPNAGKSALFNALLAREAAIVTPIAGTTRDVLEAGVARAGRPYRLIDTAGQREDAADVVERIGIGRAREAAAVADCVLWLGPPQACPRGGVPVHARADIRGDAPEGSVSVSIHRATSIEKLWDVIAERAETTLAIDAELPLRDAQRAALEEARIALDPDEVDLILMAESLRVAARALSRVLGEGVTELMLDALFARFCVGK